ncbi:transmembrane protein, putative [Medicago truncatula]|uniref:Transmembrane protein, putative n=1 Tax=Medicago truncatula TaxID=3880 RepID=G7I9U6_MEDTR|nr:transmembrane protein, putative [Medicago truncatula]
MVTIKYTQIAEILGAVKPFESWFLITTMNHFMCSNVESRILNSFIMDVVLLPPLLVADFGNDINHYATLIDPCNNQFDVAVEKGKGSIYAKPKDCSLCVISMISVSVLGSLWYMLGWVSLE